MTKRDYSETGQRSQSEDPRPLLRGAGKTREKKGGEKDLAPKRPRSGMRTKVLIMFLLFAAVGGAATFLPNLPGLFQRTPVQTKIKKEMPPKPAQKPAVREPEKPSSQVLMQVPGPVPASMEGSADGWGVKPDVPPSVEAVRNRAEASKRETEVEAGFRPSCPGMKQTVPAGKGRAPIQAARETEKENKRPVTVAPPPPRAKVRSFPYSIYLGSFRKERALQNALAIYRGRELSPYVVRMDLGEKGVWLRVFSGHFETREEAEALIKKNQISEAETKHTRYAVLMGEYSSKQEAEVRVRSIKDAGCHPYVIGVNEVILRIYAGAYYRMEDAEKELAWLASKGVKGKIVER